MKIKNVKFLGEIIYPSTITEAIKDINFVDESNNPMTLEDINLYFQSRLNSINSDETMLISNLVYGVRHYYEQASSALLRIGNLDLHRSLPILSLMRRCLLSDSGQVVYLDKNNSTKLETGEPAILDGSLGLVMVEIPQHYRKHTLNSEEKYIESTISLYPFEGAFKVNKFYISAYEASLDRTNMLLSSVVNLTPQFRGGNNKSDWDGTYKSLLGMPATSISLTSFRTYAANRGFYWKCLELDIHTTIFWLYAIEYANLNCLLAFKKELSNDGFHQGGLGNGVTNLSWDPWSTYNNNNPFIPCGYTNSLGNHTGVKSFTFTEELANVYGNSVITEVPSYRGIENPFGHIWKWTDGFLAKGNGTTLEYYICRNRTAYSSTITDDYKSVGTSPTTNGYKKEIIYGDHGDILTKAIGAGSTTYFCDYHYLAATDGTTYGLLGGGCAFLGAGAGLGSVASYAGPGGASSSIGSRTCYCTNNLIYL